MQAFLPARRSPLGMPSVRLHPRTLSAALLCAFSGNPVLSLSPPADRTPVQMLMPRTGHCSIDQLSAAFAFGNGSSCRLLSNSLNEQSSICVSVRLPASLLNFIDDERQAGPSSC